MNKFYLRKGLDDIKICQYLSLDNFLKQLIGGKYYVRRKNMFEDVTEKTLPIDFLFVPSEVNTNQKNQSKDLLDRQIQKFNRFKELSKSFVSCWTKDISSDYFMWKTYASTYGVCIMSTIKNFIASFDNRCFVNYETYVSDVIYRNFSYADEPDDLLFVKNPLYRSEQEIRFIFLPNEDSPQNKYNILLPYNYDVMIDEVRLSPFWASATSKFLKDILENKFGLKVKIK
ncbi:MAG: hypothetical protein K2H38_07285 [Muribaculaceae bacterium]|nr:hypothetical protein [Muribaculaceae bacterium]